MPEFRVIQCGKCKSRLKIPKSRTGGKCPKCQTVFQLDAATGSASAGQTAAAAKSNRTPLGIKTGKNRSGKRTAVERPQQAAMQKAASRSASPPQQPLGFVQFTSRFFKATRGPLFLWLLVVVFVCFFASFFKPLTGLGWMTYAAIGLAVLSSAFLVAFFIGRFSDYFFRKMKTLPESPSSRTASWGFASGLLAAGLGLLLVGEHFAPKEGLVASKIAWVGNIQTEFIHAVDRTSQVADATTNNETGENETGKGVPTGTETVSADSLLPKHPTNDSTTNTGVDPDEFLPQEIPSTESEPQHNRDVNNPTNAKRPVSPPVQSTDSMSGKPAVLSQTIASIPKWSGQSGRSSTSPAPSSRSVDVDDELSQIEVSLGLDSRGIAERIKPDETCEPGGAFAPKLQIPVGTKLWGGENVAPEPGGAY